MPGHPLTEDERRQHVQYEDWLIQQARVISSQLTVAEQQIGKLRKTKKPLTAKQRTVSVGCSTF